MGQEDWVEAKIVMKLPRLTEQAEEMVAVNQDVAVVTEAEAEEVNNRRETWDHY